LGFPGALTNAVLWVKKAVFAAFTAALTAELAERPDAIGGRPLNDPVIVGI
jgi:hypothetical protein